MPAQLGETDVQQTISGALQESLKETTLEEKLVASSKRVLLTNIKFESSGESISYLNELKVKYKPLNFSPVPPFDNAFSSSHIHEKISTISKEPSEEITSLVKPKTVLCSAEKLNLHWTKIYNVGAGLENCGNTCFLNATLQCLTYTPPLNHYLMSGEHGRHCSVVGFCILCDLSMHMKRVLSQPGGVVRPQAIISKVRQIAKHFRLGRQEDAHEFLRYILDVGQKSYLRAFPKDLDRYSKETTVIDQIFGGYHLSQVQCQKCKSKSNTFDHFLDISLDIKGMVSVQKALERFVQPELLQKENAYNCKVCNCKVTALKRFSVAKEPNVLTLQLKRFEMAAIGGCGRKIHDSVAYPDKLNIRPYMTCRDAAPVMYTLYGIVCHSGMGLNSGHYYAYAKSSNGVWHIFNDTVVREVKNACSVMNKGDAYVLFYIRNHPVQSSKNISNKSEPVTSERPQNIGRPLHLSTKPVQVKSSETSRNASFVNKTIIKADNVVNHAMPNTKLPHGLTINEAVKYANMKNSTLPSVSGLSPSNSKNAQLAHKRNPVSFSFSKPGNPSLSTEKTGESGKVSEQNQKPRIVLTLKRVGSNSKLRRSLVPYADQSTSENDSDAENKLKKAESVHVNNSLQSTNDTSPARNVCNSVENCKNARALSINTVADEQKSTHKLTKSDHGNFHLQGIQRTFSPLSLKNSSSITGTSTQWNVTPHLLSPGSQCSNTSVASVNSTSGNWTVTENTATSISPLEALHKQNQAVSQWTVENLCGKQQNCNKPVTTNVDRNTVKRKSDSTDNHVEEKRPTGSNCNKEIRTECNGTIKLTLRKSESTDKLPESSHSRHLDDLRQKDKKRKKRKFDTPDIESNHKRYSDNRTERHHSSGSNNSDKAKHKKRLISTDYKSNSHHRNHHNRSDISSDESHSHRKMKKHKKHKKKHRHSHCDEDTTADEYEVQWVEKTKETLTSGTRDLTKSASSVQQTIPASRDFLANAAGDRTNKFPVWARSPHSLPKSAVRELNKQNLHAYGANVLSWDEGVSYVDRDVQTERMTEHLKNRYAYDDDDVDLDKGKVKKVKHRDRENNRFHEKNLFQKFAEQKQHSRYVHHNSKFNKSYHSDAVSNNYMHRSHGKDDYHRRNQFKFSHH